MTTAMRWCRRELGLALLLWLVTAAAYLPTLKHDFIPFDDTEYVYQNSRLATGLTREGIVWAFSEPYFYNWSPLTSISYAIDYRLYNLWPGGYLLTNLLLHATGSSLLFLALARMTSALGRSSFVAGIFALHPLHVESVAWVAQRKDVLSGVFFAATLFCYARYARNPSVARYGAVASFLAGGLLTKPTLVTVPLVLLLLDIWPLERCRLSSFQTAAADLVRLGLEKVPLLVLSTISSVITFLVQQSSGVIVTSVRFPLGIRLANAALAYAAYLEKAFWPVHLAFYYPLSPDSLSLSNAALAGTVLAVVSVSAVALLRYAPYVAVGWFWFLGMLVPMIGLVQVGSQAYADRYTYLPLVGIGILVAWGAQDLAERLRIRTAGLAGAALAVLTLLLIATSLQVRLWRNGVTLCEHALRITPSATAHIVLATALFEQERFAEAHQHADEAVWLAPLDGGAHGALGFVLDREGKLQDAVQQFRLALRLDPGNLGARAGLGKVLFELRKPTEAIAVLSQTLAAGPDVRLEVEIGVALAGEGKTAEAIEHYRRALHWKPDFVSALANLGAALTQSGQLAEGEEVLRRAVALAPEMAEAQAELAENLQRQDRPAEAVVRWRETLRLRPGKLEATNNLAWLLATASESSLRSPAEAVTLAEEAAATTHRTNAAVLDTLAAAYAAAGRRTEAIATAHQAAELARQAGQEDLAREIAKRARAYQAGSAVPPAGAASPSS